MSQGSLLGLILWYEEVTNKLLLISLHLKDLMGNFNASVLIDVNNWCDFNDHTQFIVIDEYGARNKFSWDALKRLTSGDASTFGGNRQSYGASLRLRPDAPLIIFSNNHLFECLGKKKLTKEESHPSTQSLSCETDSSYTSWAKMLLVGQNRPMRTNLSFKRTLIRSPRRSLTIRSVTFGTLSERHHQRCSASSFETIERG